MNNLTNVNRNLIESISTIDRKLCKEFEKIKSTQERGEFSQNLISNMRNLVEHLMVKVYDKEVGCDNIVNFPLIGKARTYCAERNNGNYKVLNDLYNFLQINASHYLPNEDNAERLMIKYYVYLWKIREFASAHLEIEILNELENFPLDMDEGMKHYYSVIKQKIELQTNKVTSVDNDRYYVRKILPFVIEGIPYYEITFSYCVDSENKAERFLAFSKYEIKENYAVKFKFRRENITVGNTETPIYIIDNWEVSIRPCEFRRLGDIVGRNCLVWGDNEDYLELMDYIKRSANNLNDIIQFNDQAYNGFINSIFKKEALKRLFNRMRNIINSGEPGKNILLYLLYNLKNNVLKNQYDTRSNNLLSNLHLKNACIPFDQMPYASSLSYHNPPFKYLIRFIPYTDRKHELLARKVKQFSIDNRQLFFSLEQFEEFEKFEELTETADIFNSRLYSRHTNRRLESYNKHLFVNEYKNSTEEIIKELRNLAQITDDSYITKSRNYIDSSPIDDELKVEILMNLFADSSVAFVYGQAGTGKSTLINHVSLLFNDVNKVFLTNTHPALENLRQRVQADNSKFMTIRKFLKSDEVNECELLVIDECSAVSNKDINEILKRQNFNKVLFVGDSHQIESIEFGNWFSIVRKFVRASVIHELTTVYRTADNNLINFWSAVRGNEEIITDLLVANNYSSPLQDMICERESEDEVVLCLNYDGLYGINNINKLFQQRNNRYSVDWGVATYKIGDPIIFLDNEKYGKLLYNNLKGKIIDIIDDDNKIMMDLEVFREISDMDFLTNSSIVSVGNSENNYPIIRLSFYKIENNEDEGIEIESSYNLPFQVAYAMSIHKAQGLEFESVKIMIPKELASNINYNIFYTAITRSKGNLKIYWSPETQQEIVKSLTHQNKYIGRDVAFLIQLLN